ncbi:hypothetical protein GJ744_006869 [Endocarpon pusillum]|uniref:Uncharacterized protein n=1 Tax=Endocarpon pusillum TaxID=364733 RepID=A0A8H7A6C8_9EURO|nr:hypothetical protein GJ744_006869 [Endocarpon pusillum]
MSLIDLEASGVRRAEESWTSTVTRLSTITFYYEARDPQQRQEYQPSTKHDTWHVLWWLRRGADTRVVVRRYGSTHEIGATSCLDIGSSREKRRKGYAILKLNET